VGEGCTNHLREQDRAFLEHSRILDFRAGGRVSTWIGSADLMPRNLDRRVEVLAPVEDTKLRARIAGVLDALPADTQFARALGADGTWSGVDPAPGKKRCPHRRY
jgi:polyphosphate kinase